jgi:hypothetical protein
MKKKFMFWMESFDVMEPHLKKFKDMTNKLHAIKTTIPKEVKLMFYHLDYGVINEFSR